MSLLNDMLNDLENHRADRKQGSEEKSLPTFIDTNQASTEASDENSSMPGFLPGLMIGVLVLGGLYFVYVFASGTAQSTNVKTSLAESSASDNVAEEFVSSLENVGAGLLNIQAVLQNGMQTLGGSFYLALSEVVGSRQPNEPGSQLALQSQSTTAPGGSTQSAENAERGSVAETDTLASKSNPPAREEQEASWLQIAKSARSRDEEASARARVLLEKKQPRRAEALLLEEVNNNTEAILSVQLLADFYFDRAAKSRLSELSANTAFADNSLRSYVLARYYTLSGEKQLALSLLESGQAHPLIKSPYLGLQAALYQQTGANEEAVALYQKLLLNNQQDSTLWLGYGLSCDASERKEKALQAYRQALRLQIANPKIRNYVQTRVRDLQARLTEQS